MSRKVSQAERGRLPPIGLVAAWTTAMGAICFAMVATAQTKDAVTEAFAGIEPIAHVRTYYFEGTSTSGSQSEAWALGGWAGLKTPWYGDLLQLSVIGYTSQKLYGPADKPGSELLSPSQGPITVLGQAYASLRYAGQTFTGYRQMVDQPWVNPNDSRMIPNLFEGYLLSGKVAQVDYLGGYLTKFKARDSDTFEWMSSAAGSSGPQRGMILFGAQVPLSDGADIRIAEQYLIDNYNTAYVDGQFVIPLDADNRLRLRGQYAGQQAVGIAGLGRFNTWMYGIAGAFEHGPFAVQAAWTQTSRNKETQAPFGQNPSYLYMMQVAFNDANEKAWLVGGSLDFMTLGAAGLKLDARYGNGHGAIDPSTGASLGSRNETDVVLGYAFDKSTSLHGLSLGIEGSWLNQAGAAAQGTQLRMYANYDISWK